MQLRHRGASRIIDAGRVIAPTYRQPEAVLDVVKDAARRVVRMHAFA